MNDSKKVEKINKTLKELIADLQEKLNNNENCSIGYIENMKNKINSELNLAMTLAGGDATKLIRTEYMSAVDLANKGLLLVGKLQNRGIQKMGNEIDMNFKKMASNFEYEVTDQEIEDLFK